MTTKRKLDPYTLSWAVRQMRIEARIQQDESNVTGCDAYEHEYWMGGSGALLGMAGEFRRQARALSKKTQPKRTKR